MPESTSHREFIACGASVAGTRHIQGHIPCEDAWACEILPGHLIIAAADGLSSAERGGDGAKIVVTSCVRAAAGAIRSGCENPSHGADITETGAFDIPAIIRSAVRGGRKALVLQAETEGIPLSSYATTVMIAILSPQGVCCGHIGDGVCVRALSGEVSLLSKPGNAEYANETPVLTGTDWEKQLRISSGAADAVLLATDGCQGALMQREEGALIPYSPFVVPLVRSLERFFREGRDCNGEISDLLSSPRMRALSSDDMTLAVGLRLSGENL